MSDVKPQIGAVKCMPPHSDNKLIFFAYKAVQSAGVKYKSWNDAREGNLRDVGVMPPSRVDIGRQFAKTQRPPLIRYVHSLMHPNAVVVQEALGVKR